MEGQLQQSGRAATSAAVERSATAGRRRGSIFSQFKTFAIRSSYAADELGFEAEEADCLGSRGGFGCIAR